jgi:putative FmdB family regulatory protein
VPTYQYACTSCGEELEVVQKFTDDPLTVCPSCEGTLRKRFSAVGVVFKGSGFYRTDSRNGSGAGAKEAGTKDAGATEKGNGTDGAAAAGGSGSKAEAGNGSKPAAKAGAASPASSSAGEKVA